MREARPGGQQTHLEICSCRDLLPSQLPTLDFGHFAPQCVSVSPQRNSMGEAYLRTEANNFLGPPGDRECEEYDLDLAWIIDVIKDQRSRPGNEDFKFIVEAPEGVARKLVQYKWIEMPTTHGGCGATRTRLHYCKFGTEYMKPTYFWTNIEPMIASLHEANGQPHMRMCASGHFCANGPDNHANLGREGGQTCKAAAYPQDLVAFLVQHIEQATAPRRRDNLPACPAA